MTERIASIATEPLELVIDGHELPAERYGVVGDEAGWDNPQGITVVGANGNSVKQKHWRRFREALLRDGQQRGLDVSLVTLEDGDYHDQETHTEAISETVRQVHQKVAAGHRIWIAGWSRGGISAVQAAGDGGHLAEAGMISGVLTMGTPTVPMESVETKKRPALSLPAVSPMEVFSPDALENIGTKTEEFSLKLSVVTQAVRRVAANREAVAAEAAEVEATNISGKLVDLSHMPGVQVVTVFYDGDEFVPPEPHILGLQDADAEADTQAERKFGGKIIRLPGTHFRPLVDPATREVLLDSADMAA